MKETLAEPLEAPRDISGLCMPMQETADASVGDGCATGDNFACHLHLPANKDDSGMPSARAGSNPGF
jgi:hypothetical protein